MILGAPCARSLRTRPACTYPAWPYNLAQVKLDLTPIRDPDSMNPQPWQLCIAPMMEWTDRHCRAFHRCLSPNARLYTEMVTTGALIHGPRERLLAHSPCEHPVALQLGGNDPADLARCAHLAQAAGYDEVNLNVGCPSDRVQHAAIGACLMREPVRVADALKSMRDAVDIPVTLKCRLGVDEQDDYAFLYDFVATVAPHIDALMLHARKAILRGLSAAQNRSVPPLNYPRVHQLKVDFPQLPVIINGGIRSVEEARVHWDDLDGVMIGRAAYQNPWLIAELEQSLFDTSLPESPHAVLERFVPYVEAELANGTRLHAITRHMHGLFNSLPGARRFRRHLSDHATAKHAGIDVLLEAASYVRSTQSRPSNDRSMQAA